MPVSSVSTFLSPSAILSGTGSVAELGPRIGSLVDARATRSRSEQPPPVLLAVDQFLVQTGLSEVVVSALREAGLETPVLMVSALGDVDDRVFGLRAGGDDYLIKPFAPSELVARLEVLLRRRNRAGKGEHRLQVGDLELDLVTREAARGGRRVELLPMEFKLLEYMMRNAGQTLSRRMIFEAVWEYYFDPGTNLIDVHVAKLRKKIDDAGAPSLIKTERGQGYVLNAH